MTFADDFRNGEAWWCYYHGLSCIASRERDLLIRERGQNDEAAAAPELTDSLVHSGIARMLGARPAPVTRPS